MRRSSYRRYLWAASVTLACSSPITGDDPNGTPMSSSLTAGGAAPTGMTQGMAGATMGGMAGGMAASGGLPPAMTPMAGAGGAMPMQNPSLAGAAPMGGGTGGMGPAGGATTGGEPGLDPMATAGTGGEAMTSMGGMGPEPITGDRSVEGTCERWNADRENLDEGTWSGSVASCDPGDISADGRENALRQYNLYRWLAELPAVTTDPERDQRAQACALMMEANSQLSHDPPMSWECWSEDGADSAGSSNISTGPGVASADGYMVDPGNETTLGHRRWILSNSLGPIGLGSTGDGASCMQTLYGEGEADKEWMAWPPPGVFPLQGYEPEGSFRRSYTDTGWSLQSDDIDLDDAEVSVSRDEMDLPVTVEVLLSGYGSRHAISFIPDGWDVEEEGTYVVTITGVPDTIRYEVQFVDCGG